ncbi:MAG: hypothetical protein ABI434_14100 [Burkholderiaceae bacterium]
MAATVAVLVIWAVASHLGSAGIGGANFAALAAVLPLVLAGVVLFWKRGGAGWRVAGLFAVSALLVTLWPILTRNATLLYFLEHVGSMLALAALFGRSLIGPGDALITSMARTIYGGTLSERKQRYTRQVTFAWTVFFLANVVVSTALFWLAPVRIWSFYAHLLMGPLVALMFLGEHLVRLRVLPPQERPSLTDVLRAYRQRASGPAMHARDTELRP